MNRYGGRGPNFGGPSKATATTLCQKCLKRGHYSYECKESATARPYTSRPSRTQQLFNPKLMPKLTNDAPQDLLRKKGIADEQLARAEMERERGRKRARLSEDPEELASKRRRSASSVSSVSSISTSRSRSLTPGRSSRKVGRESPMREIIRERSRATRSPPPEAGPSDLGKRRRESISTVDSYSSRDEKGSSSRDDGRSTRRRFQERSPLERGRQTESHTPPPRERRKLSNDRKGGRNRYSYENGSGNSNSNNGTERRSDMPRKERSLSPFSKRLALTQAMNGGQ